jgi:hypothetical protein
MPDDIRRLVAQFRPLIVAELHREADLDTTVAHMLTLTDVEFDALQKDLAETCSENPNREFDTEALRRAELLRLPPATPPLQIGILHSLEARLDRGWTICKNASENQRSDLEDHWIALLNRHEHACDLLGRSSTLPPSAPTQFEDNGRSNPIEAQSALLQEKWRMQGDG